MRADPANRVFGDLRINVVVAAVLFAGAIAYLVLAPKGRGEFSPPDPEESPATREDA